MIHIINIINIAYCLLPTAHRVSLIAFWREGTQGCLLRVSGGRLGSLEAAQEVSQMREAYKKDPRGRDDQ